MSTVYLIDGYNLLYAMGVLLPGRTGPTGLDKARLRLLGLLHGAHGDESHQVTVVFDAARAPPGAPAEHDYHGLHVRFAVAEKEADALIEALIQTAAVPKHLTVVSDDHRIQQAARRRHCVVQGCQEYLDWLDRRRRAPQPQAPETPDKQPMPSRQDKDHWLAVFGNLDGDPDMKDVFDPFGFRDE
jgi:predicted RNA-binding protein with PIN domain